MSQEKAQQEIRLRQIEVAQRFMKEKGRATTKEINDALEAAGLPPARDHVQLDNILNGLHDVGPDEQRLRLEAQALQMHETAAFLREGNYANLKDAMDKLGLDLTAIDALIERRCLDALGYKTD